MTTTTLIVPDVQMPYDDGLVLKKIVRVAKDIQPDQIVQIGDLVDQPQASRWNKATAGEYVDTLQSHIQDVKDRFFTPMREAAPKAKFLWVSGNHDERIHDYVTKYAYALRSLKALSLESLFDLDAYGVQYVKGPVHVAPNTMALHGHECGGYSATLSAWDAKFARRYGSDQNYIFGHTHQPGITGRAYGYSGKVKDRWTMNVGSVMDPVAATYVKDGAVSWVQSFALLRDDGKRVWPELTLMSDRGFWLNGKKY